MKRWSITITHMHYFIQSFIDGNFRSAAKKKLGHELESNSDRHYYLLVIYTPL